jgi:DNA-binding XRE family transcriptional regulator
LWSGGPFVLRHGGSPLSEADSQLPFPLRPAWFPMPVATGPASQARGPTYVYGRSLAGLSKSIVVPRTPQDPESQAALGKAIRQLRNKQGKSQATLANDAGITPNMLSLIERGEGNPSWATVQGIARSLGVSVAKLAQVAEAQVP